MMENDSTGEDLIADFFDEKSIEFVRQKNLGKLQIGDSAECRIADFYLPKYNIYVEFFGMWYDEQHRQRYCEKISAYNKNKIPFIVLFPDNLGTINWMFKFKLRQAFFKYNQMFPLTVYEIKNYFVEHHSKLLLITIASFFLIFNETGLWIKIGVLLSILFLLYYSISKNIKRLLRIKKTKYAQPSDSQSQK